MNRRAFLRQVVVGMALVMTPYVRELPPARLYQFENFIFPIFANMAPCPILTDLMAVQPMTVSPDAKVFYLDFVTSRDPWWQVFLRRMRPTFLR